MILFYLINVQHIAQCTQPECQKCTRHRLDASCWFYQLEMQFLQSTWINLIGGFHSILLHGTTLGGQLYTYCRFVPCGSEQISSNCVHMLPNTRSMPIIKNYFDPTTVSILGWPPSAKPITWLKSSYSWVSVTWYV